MHRLREFDRVVVSLPEAGALQNASFDAHVLAIAGTTVALEPVSRPSVTWLPEQVQDAFVTFVHRDSLIALRGSLSMRGSVGDLRFKVTDPSNPDRRHATRLDVCLPVSLYWTDTSTRSECLTVSVGADGLLVDCADPSDVGRPADLTLSLPGSDEPLEVSAHVARVDAGKVALRLSSAAPEARSRIARFVLERNRVRLRLRLEMHEDDDIDF